MGTEQPGGMRITVAVATVLRVFLDDPSAPRYGYECMRLTGFASGKLYPILARLEFAGWLTSSVEDIDPIREGRPPRRLYLLTAGGAAAARTELASLAQRVSPAASFRGRPSPAGGLS